MGLVFNRQRKTKAESKHYYHTTLLYGDTVVDILLTHNDVKRGMKRASRNLEDIPKKWYTSILFWR
tara:strand:+ start:400 stop:597 length:198 start_codon:yes stop_codon:yes gene_type:complete